ncbi:MAG: carbohydrate kinase family protein [Blautia sp.]|nr:carbohydrate kinase family protein [Blautia sp.]MDY5030304.1 carbohydrate kinase family protein [Blautia sp.]
MNMNDTCDVVIVGAAHMDLQLYPVGREVLDVASYPVKEMVWSVGGDSLNESTIITRLGHNVKLVSCIGDDMIGSMVVEHCEKNNIDTTYLKRDKNKVTGINVGLIGDDGERTFINNRSGSIWTFCPEDVEMDAVCGGQILSFASIFNNPLLDESLMIPLFERAKAQGMIICADIVGAKRGEKLEDIKKPLSYVDYFFPNYDEAKELVEKDDPDEIADVLLSLGVKNVIIKIGKKGCLVKNSRERFIVPGYPKSNCIDTTGAGDNFASGFICGLLEGKSLKECAEFANCTASIAVEAVGATDGVKSREQVDERYREYLKLISD